MPLQKLLCRHKKQFYWMQIIFLSGTNFLWLPQYVNRFFGLAQKIWTCPKHFGTCKRTRHKLTITICIFWWYSIVLMILSHFDKLIDTWWFNALFFFLIELLSNLPLALTHSVAIYDQSLHWTYQKQPLPPYSMYAIITCSWLQMALEYILTMHRGRIF